MGYARVSFTFRQLYWDLDLSCDTVQHHYSRHLFRDDFLSFAVYTVRVLLQENGGHARNGAKIAEQKYHSTHENNTHKASKNYRTTIITTSTNMYLVHKNKNNLQLNHPQLNHIHSISNHDALG
jgi:hypothetical protein